MRAKVVGVVVAGALAAPAFGAAAQANPWEKIQPTYELAKCSVTAVQNGESIFWKCLHPGP